MNLVVLTDEVDGIWAVRGQTDLLSTASQERTYLAEWPSLDAGFVQSLDEDAMRDTVEGRREVQEDEDCDVSFVHDHMDVISGDEDSFRAVVWSKTRMGGV